MNLPTRVAILSRKIDLPEFRNANFSVPTSPPPLRTWDFMETIFVSLIAYGVFALTSGLALTMLAIPDDGTTTTTLSPAQFQAYGVAYIVASPLTIAVLWIAIRMARRDF